MNKSIDWDQMVLTININRKKLSRLRFADDIILFADKVDEAVAMLGKLHCASIEVGLNINFSKTKYMTNLVLSERIMVDGMEVE